MKGTNKPNDWEKELRRFPEVWARVQNGQEPKAAPAPPLMPGKCCHSRAVRYKPK